MIPLSEAQRPAFDWLGAPHLKRICAALEATAPGAVRYVGGCVRDSLLGVEPKDFDIATTLTPDDVISAAKAAKLKYAPTGVEHGTVTVIADHRGVEVTTLRADVSTDGRRATVAFTDDWTRDAGRRDFTINAIYLTPDGFLHDPMNGLADIEIRHVRFIGDAEQRIREDYLRILRFFRFSARFAGGFDEAGLQASRRLKGGIASLSGERVGAETMAILNLPRAAFGLEAMATSGVLAEIWHAHANIDAIARLKKLAPGAPAPVALAALFGAGGDGIGARLRLSNAEKAVRSNALKSQALIAPNLSDRDVRRLIYQLGRDVFMDGTQLAAAFMAISEPELERLAEVAETWTAPSFPIQGSDVVAAGVTPGARVGRILAAVESQWIAEDFPSQTRARVILKEKIAHA
jgi:poly(A) polymerase